MSLKLDNLETFEKHRNNISESLTTKIIGRNKAIDEITKKLFSIDYESDFADETLANTYEKIADDQISNYNWQDVYNSWYQYLIKKCKTEQDILNFANLFWFYGGYNYRIVNAVELSAYLYGNISFENHPEAISVIDGIAYKTLTNSGIIDEKTFSLDNFSPCDIPELDLAIKNMYKKI